MKIKNLIKVTALLFITQISFGQGFDMGGPPPKKKEKSRSEITSPTKHEYSEVQKKYKDQIVFSNSIIGNKKENPTEFINTWDMNDPLFYRVYHSNTVAEGVYDFTKEKGEKYDEYYFASFATITVVYINGKEMAYKESVFSKDKAVVEDWITHSGYIINPEKPSKTNADLGVAFQRALGALGDEYKEGSVFDVKFEIYAASSALDDFRNQRDKKERTSLLSSGGLKIKVSKEGMKKYAPILCREMLKTGTRMVDPELEKQVMIKYNESYGNKVTDANITSEDWRVVKNSLGYPLQRNLSTNVTYIHDDKQYICEYFINQTYNGNGYQKSINSSSVGETRPYSPYCIAYKQELVK